VSALLNQRCVLALDIESMFRVEMLKILLQQYLHVSDITTGSGDVRLRGQSSSAADIVRRPVLTQLCHSTTDFAVTYNAAFAQ
jgi:hypothetical protein